MEDAIGHKQDVFIHLMRPSSSASVALLPADSCRKCPVDRPLTMPFLGAVVQSLDVWVIVGAPGGDIDHFDTEFFEQN